MGTYADDARFGLKYHIGRHTCALVETTLKLGKPSPITQGNLDELDALLGHLVRLGNPRSTTPGRYPVPDSIVEGFSRRGALAALR
jgi:hypothetical protein